MSARITSRFSRTSEQGFQMTTASPTDPKAYRAIWRWHFYAGLIVAPFLLILAVTGSIYLFNDEIDDALYPSQRFVAAHAASVGPSLMISAALKAYPGAATRIDLPGENIRSIRYGLRWIRAPELCSDRRSTRERWSASRMKCTVR
jgi:hypothetical protein